MVAERDPRVLSLVTCQAAIEYDLASGAGRVVSIGVGPPTRNSDRPFPAMTAQRKMSGFQRG